MPRYALPSEVDTHTATQVHKQAVAALQSASGDWTIDAGGLERFDSAGLAVLMELRRAAPGQQLTIERPPERLRDLAQAYGVAFLLSGS